MVVVGLTIAGPLAHAGSCPPVISFNPSYTANYDQTLEMSSEAEVISQIENNLRSDYEKTEFGDGFSCRTEFKGTTLIDANYQLFFSYRDSAPKPYMSFDQLIDFLQLDIEARNAAYFEFRSVCTSGRVVDPYLTFTRQVVKKTKYLKQCQTYRIVLLPDNASPEGQTIAELEPGKTVVVRALVYDQNGQSVPGIDVELTSTVIAHSGGHQHDDGVRHNQHMGKLSCASTECTTVPSGKVLNGKTNGLRFTFTAPAPAGDHKIKATCLGRDCTLEGPDKVWVGVKDIKQQASSINYVLLPNRDTNHPGNHYVTTNTERNLSNFAAAYHRRFPDDPVLHFNDASLVRGGLFDVASNWSIYPGHETHRLGANVDVKANEFYHEPSQSIPVSNYIDFWNMGKRYGCYAALHSGATPNEHFHLHCP